MPDRATSNDPVLAHLLTTGADEATRNHWIQELVTRVAQPKVESALRADMARAGTLLSHETLQDLTSEVALRLVRKLRRLTEDPHTEPIPHFHDYVRTIAFNLLLDHERRNQPLRTQLTNRVRYVLTHTRRLAVWDRDPTVCGLAKWSGVLQTVKMPPLQRLPAAVIEDSRALRRIVERAAEAAGGPVELRALVSGLIEAADFPPQAFVPATELTRKGLLVDPLERLEGHEYLTLLWREIGQLPYRQRHALLLQLRLADGDSVLKMLPTLGIADIRTVARTLEMPLDQLVESWRELPLDDLRIAARLGVTRQQVINLRKSARERLARRMGRAR